MVFVLHWSAQEVRALRAAMRLSLNKFAAHIGVSERMVSKWESETDQDPGTFNQGTLDKTLQQCDPDVHARFAYRAGESENVVDRDDSAAPPDRTAVVEDLVQHPVDGTTMARVDGSVFLSGPDNRPAWVGEFWVDAVPVTNRAYGVFVAATGHSAPQHWQDGNPPEKLLEHPVTYVSWRDAAAYAEWAGKSLPTWEQWEKAARGTRGNIYPWGDQATPAKTNVRENGVGATTPVGTYQTGISPYGVWDLCGNVWEWTCSQSTPGRYQLRGGSWTSPFSRVTPSAFNDADAETMRDDDTGFRCVASTESVGK